MTLYIQRIYQKQLKLITFIEGLPPLILRFILAPVFIIAGYNKLGMSQQGTTIFEGLLAHPDVVAWFANPDWGLGLPFPELLAFLAGWTELIGGILLVFGLLTRLISIPLMITMVVAMTSVHSENGWFAITPTNSDTSAAQVFSWIGFDSADKSLENSIAAGERLDKIKSIVAEHGFPDYLYEKGNIVILNNGIEFGFIYFAMLFSLFVSGGGRFTSVDYVIKRKMFQKPVTE